MQCVNSANSMQALAEKKSAITTVGASLQNISYPILVMPGIVTLYKIDQDLAFVQRISYAHGGAR